MNKEILKVCLNLPKRLELQINMIPLVLPQIKTSLPIETKTDYDTREYSSSKRRDEKNELTRRKDSPSRNKDSASGQKNKPREERDLPKKGTGDSKKVILVLQETENLMITKPLMILNAQMKRQSL